VLVEQVVVEQVEVALCLQLLAQTVLAVVVEEPLTPVIQMAQ
jgi:hypothetical protein